MVAFLTGLFPGRAAIIAAVILACLTGSYFLGRSHEADGWRLREAKHLAAAQEAIAIEQAKQRQIEEQRQQAADAAQKGLDDARQQIAARDSAIAALRTDAGGLRQQLAQYAGRACTDPGAPGVSATLADLAAEGAELLAEGGELLRSCAREHDERAAEVRALIEAWPKP